jgi:hypothetical protein
LLVRPFRPLSPFLLFLSVRPSLPVPNLPPCPYALPLLVIIVPVVDAYLYKKRKYFVVSFFSSPTARPHRWIAK